MKTDKHPPHTHPHHKHRWLRGRLGNIAAGIVLGLVFASGIVAWQINSDEKRVLQMQHEAQQAAINPAAKATIGGAFTLMDLKGKVVTEQDFRGKYVLVNFGYTFCPDMCPTGLQSIAHALTALGDKAQRVQPLFISIDPARDTAEKLEDYVASFDPRIVALRGTDAQTAEVAKAYQVYYAKKESEDGPDAYEMDHSALIYLMDPEGKFVASFPDEVDPATLVTALHDAWGEKEAVSSAPPQIKPVTQPHTHHHIQPHTQPLTHGHAHR